MDLSENAEWLLGVCKLLVEDRVARGDDLPTAYRHVATEWDELADKLKHGISVHHHDTGSASYSSPGVIMKNFRNVTIKSAPPREYVIELRNVSGILRLRAAIAELEGGREASADGLIKHAGLKRKLGLALLRWLQSQGEYHGHAGPTPNHFNK